VAEETVVNLPLRAEDERKMNPSNITNPHQLFSGLYNGTSHFTQEVQPQTQHRLALICETGEPQTLLSSSICPLQCGVEREHFRVTRQANR